MSRQHADRERYEVQQWGAAHWFAVLTPVLGLALASLLRAEWPMALVCAALGVMWAVPLGVARRTVADSQGLVSHGSPWPWSVRQTPWTQVTELRMTSTELWMVPVDGDQPFALPGCRWSVPPRRTRERQLARARGGPLRLRPPQDDGEMPPAGRSHPLT